MISKSTKQLQIIFAALALLFLFVFGWDVIYTSKHVTSVENTTLERWAIILTLGGIFASLKLLHPRLKEEQRNGSRQALKKYIQKYHMRTAAITGLFAFNITCLHITGAANFKYLAFIVIFAFFLCLPNKKQIEEEIKNEEPENV